MGKTVYNVVKPLSDAAAGAAESLDAAKDLKQQVQKLEKMVSRFHF